MEASAAASLNHANIVTVHEVGVHDGQHYLAMQYIPSQTLARLAGGQPLPPKRAAAYVKTIAEAIHFAHGHAVLHRDLKPSNVLIDENDQPHLSDFGLAKRLDADMDLTFSGQILGSPSYMSPEQAGSIEHSRVIRYDGADENIADGGCFALFESCLGRLQNNPPGSSTGSDSPCGDHRTR